MITDENKIQTKEEGAKIHFASRLQVKIVTPEWLANNLLITIDEKQYTLNEFLHHYWRLEETVKLLALTLEDVMESLSERFNLTPDDDIDVYSPDEVAALIASGHIKQRDNWKPEDEV
jgi:hypothetical protein